jgi:hypothetical protein
MLKKRILMEDGKWKMANCSNPPTLFHLPFAIEAGRFSTAC